MSSNKISPVGTPSATPVLRLLWFMFPFLSLRLLPFAAPVFIVSDLPCGSPKESSSMSLLRSQHALPCHRGSPGSLCGLRGKVAAVACVASVNSFFFVALVALVVQQTSLPSFAVQLGALDGRYVHIPANVTAEKNAEFQK